LRAAPASFHIHWRAVSVHQGGVPVAGATGLMTHCEWVKPMAEEQVYPRLNHPVIVLYDAAEGELKGIIVGEITCSELPDNIAVTGLRTAATSAVGNRRSGAARCIEHGHLRRRRPGEKSSARAHASAQVKTSSLQPQSENRKQFCRRDGDA
jgi:hypothetical protein